MITPFTQRIAFWYNKRCDGLRVFDLLCEKYFLNNDNVSKIIKSYTSLRIEFKNGDLIEFIPLGNSSRGHRYSASFVIMPEFTIECLKEVQIIIKPMTTLLDGGVYVIDNIDNETSIINRIMWRRNIDDWFETKLKNEGTYKVID